MADPADGNPVAANDDDDHPMDSGRSLVDQDDDGDDGDAGKDDEEDHDDANDGDDDDDNHEEGDDETDEDPLAHLSPEIRAHLQDLKELEQQRVDQMKNYLTERAALERKYQARLEPLYERRRTIVPHIPQFWACALTNNDTVAEWVNEDDARALEYLTDITNHDSLDGQGFSLTFHFRENYYFTNPTLTKTYVIPNLLFNDQEPNLKLVQGEKIHWKRGKSLTHREIIRQQRGKGRNAGRIRTVTKQEELESFFTWFAPPPMPINAEEMDEEEADRLDEIFELDYELALAIRSEIIPQAVLWFTDEANHLPPPALDDDPDREDNNDVDAAGSSNMS